MEGVKRRETAMPRKTVVLDHDQFRPPGFDLKRYNGELKPRTPEDWYQAMNRRWEVLCVIEGPFYDDGDLPPHEESNLYRNKECQFYLPEVFGELGDPPPTLTPAGERSQADTIAGLNAQEEATICYVRDLTTTSALALYGSMRSHRGIARTLELMRPGKGISFYDPWEEGALTFAQWSGPLLSLFKTKNQDVVATHIKTGKQGSITVGYISEAIPVEVNLHGPDAEIIAAFTRWLASARDTYNVPEPRPEVLNKSIRKPVITQAMLHDWHRDRILPFLDLYLWNRLYNPPPCKGLWKATTPGRFSSQGATWTCTTETWMTLIGWDDARTFRRDILGKALKLLDRQIVDLLGAFARRNSEPPLSES